MWESKPLLTNQTARGVQLLPSQSLCHLPNSTPAFLRSTLWIKRCTFHGSPPLLRLSLPSSQSQTYLSYTSLPTLLRREVRSTFWEFSIEFFSPPFLSSSMCIFRSNFSLPFPEQKAPYYKELEAAASVVERACRLCIDVIIICNYFLLIRNNI